LHRVFPVRGLALAAAGLGVSAADPARAFRLDGRVAVVTGASAGIGEVLAEGLAAAGAKVVLAARRKDRLEALAARVLAAGGDAHAVACDVARADDVERLARETLQRFGRVDVLVSNAAIVEIVPAENEPLESFESVLDVNLTGTFRCAQRFGREMLAQRSGSIVNIASILGVVGVGQIPQAGYAASKGGVVNLTRELAAQWARRGVRVNAIAPAWFPSEMTADMFDDEASQKWMHQRTPMGRPGRVEELVGPLLFLASDAASYVTGHVLLVDGGWTCV
jgi:NAD(P)-dependent dehydrogenase (short-subunit alcohol dehydrogenase family)